MGATPSLPVLAKAQSESEAHGAAPSLGGQVLQAVVFAIVGALAVGATVPRAWMIALVPGYEAIDLGQEASPSVGGADPSALAQVDVAVRLTEARDAVDEAQWTKAVALFDDLARRGDPEAQHQLGVLYYYGRGVPRDEIQAAHWQMKAARQGHARAQHDVGMLFHLGHGVPQDRDEAIAWYRKAAAQGRRDAWAKLQALDDATP